MSTSGISGYTSLAALNTQSDSSGSTKRATGSDLGQDEFLKLLAAQLANQDPMEPVSDTDFIAQMAQFSSLEQMQELNSSASSTQAYSLIGKNVMGAITEDDGSVTQVYGEVTGVVRQDGADYLHVGSYLVPVSSVSAVYDDNSMDGIVSDAANLIGKTIEATLPADSESGETTKVSGIVDSIVVKNGLLYAMVGDKEVQVGYITKISEPADSGADTGDSTGTDDAADETA